MALTAARDTVQFGDKPFIENYNWIVKPGSTIYQGALVGLLAGVLAPMSGSSALMICAGRARQTVVGDGILTCEVEPGCFKWANSSTDACLAHLNGTIVYAQDDQTVAKSSNSGVRSIAGVQYTIDADGGVVVTTVLSLTAALIS